MISTRATLKGSLRYSQMSGQQAVCKYDPSTYAVKRCGSARKTHGVSCTLERIKLRFKKNRCLLFVIVTVKPRLPG